MPKSRAAMHLDTVFSFCDRDLVTVFREVVDQIRCYSIYPADGDGRLEVRAGRGAPARRRAGGAWAEASCASSKTGGNA